MDFLAIPIGKVHYLLFFLIFISGCETNEKEKGTGKVNLSVLEPIEADEGISGIFISIKKIELKGPEGWSTYKEFDSPLQLNLLDKEASLNHFLGEKQLPAGKYDEARLVLENIHQEHNDVTITSGGFLQYNNGEIKPVHIPSNSENGISAKGKFNLAAEEVVNITLKFDIREAVKDTANSEVYLLKPQINMVVNKDSGIIEGIFEENQSYGKIVVLAYPANETSKAEILTKIAPKKLLETPSGSSVLNENGKFILSFLKSGKYDLYFYSDNNNASSKTLIGKLENIEIEAGQKTIVNVPNEILID